MSELPAALAGFFRDEALALDGRSVDGAPWGRRGGRVETRRAPATDAQGWVALLDAGDTTLVASITPPHAVMLEDRITVVVDRLEALEPILLPKISKLEPLLTAPSVLIEAGRYAEAEALLRPVRRALELSSAPTAKARSYEQRRIVATLHNLYGVALKGVGRLDEARSAFELAAKDGNHNARLNLMALFEAAGESQSLIDFATSFDLHFDDEANAWRSSYLARAYLDLGEVAAAESSLRDLVHRHEVTRPALIDLVRTGLEQYVAADRPGVVDARGFLTWVTPKRYVLEPQRVAEARSWWNRVPRGMRTALLAEIAADKTDPDAATDLQLARSLEVEALTLEDDLAIDDEQLLLVLPLLRLQRLRFTGQPASLEPLRALPHLASLTINNIVVKQLEWPSRADRDLLLAAATSDRAGVDAALAAGASIAARGDHGRSAFALAALRHDVSLCRFLLTRGADPWAGDHGDAASSLGAFTEEDRAQLIADALAAGIPHPDADPYRVLGVSTRSGAATFQTASPLGDRELDKGCALARDWPADVALSLRSPHEHRMHDVMALGYATPVVSLDVARLLADLPSVELLPVTLLDTDKAPMPGTYYVLNPLAKDCLVIERCFPTWNHIDRDAISSLAAVVIDDDRTDGAQLFRPTRMCSPPIIAAAALAAKLAGCTGLDISYLKR